MRNVLNLIPGEWSYIKSLKLLDGTCKLLTLGIMPKAKVTYVRRSPFGGSLYLRINDHFVAVRESEAASIEIE